MDDLQILTLREGVRLRSNMYFGSTDTFGIHAALKSLIETSVDEYGASHSSFIEVTLTRDGWAVISDDGQGVRVDTPPEFNGRSFLEVALTEFLVDGFGVAKRSSYDLLPATPAVAAEFDLETHRDGRCYRIGFTQGLITQPFTDEGPSDRRGTTMRWKPDPAIFGDHTVDTQLLRRYLEILAAVYCGLRIHFCDERTDESATYYHPNGCADLLRVKNADQRVAYPVISIQMECEDVKFDLAFQHLSSGVGWIHSYVNADATDDGSHVRGFLTGLASSIRQIGTFTGCISAADVDSNSVRPGLTALLSIVTENAHFESPTRSVLHHPAIGITIAQQVQTRLMTILTEHPSLQAALLQSIVKAG